MVAYTRRSVGCGLTDESFNEVQRMADRRGITVSELVRHYIEEGLSNPTPNEIRRLNDRLSTIEKALKELYTMAILNWAQVEEEPPKPRLKLLMPWQPGFMEQWKARLKEQGLVDEETGEIAYDKLEPAPDVYDFWNDPMNDFDEQACLRDMWKADGSWTEEEEKQYQESRKRVPKYTRKKKKTSGRKTRKAAGPKSEGTKPAKSSGEGNPKVAKRGTRKPKP